MNDQHLMKTALGLALQEARAEANVTQSQIAAAAGIDKTTVSEWERGKGGFPEDDLVEASYTKLTGRTVHQLWERGAVILGELVTQRAAQRRVPRASSEADRDTEPDRYAGR